MPTAHNAPYKVAQRHFRKRVQIATHGPNNTDELRRERKIAFRREGIAGVMALKNAL